METLNLEVWSVRLLNQKIQISLLTFRISKETRRLRQVGLPNMLGFPCNTSVSYSRSLSEFKRSDPEPLAETGLMDQTKSETYAHFEKTLDPCLHPKYNNLSLGTEAPQGDSLPFASPQALRIATVNPKLSHIALKEWLLSLPSCHRPDARQIIRLAVSRESGRHSSSSGMLKGVDF